MHRVDYDFQYKCACKGNHCLCFKKYKGGDWKPFHIVNEDREKNCEKKKDCNAKPDFDRFYKCVCKDGKCVCWKGDKAGNWERIERKKECKKSRGCGKHKCCSKHKSIAKQKGINADRFYKCVCKGGRCICWKREKEGRWERVERKRECTKPCCAKKAHRCHKREDKRTQVTQWDADFLKDICFYY